MKKIILLLMLTVTAPLSYAQEAEGVIEELKICGTGAQSGARWSKILMVKIDGKWFGTYAEHYGSEKDYDDNLSTSILLTAFSQNLVVKIKATDNMDPSLANCGKVEGKMFHSNGEDYISIVK